MNVDIANAEGAAVAHARAGGDMSTLVGRLLDHGASAASGVLQSIVGFGIKTASATDMLKLAQGGILEPNSIGLKNSAAPGQNEQKVFHRPLLGLASQHLYLPLAFLTRNGASFEWLLQANGADVW